VKIAWNLKQIAFAAFLCLAVGLAGIWILAQKGTLEEDTVPVEIEKVLDASKIDAFSISTDTADLTFVKSASNELKIKLTGHVMEADVEHTSIETEEKDNGKGLHAVVRTGKYYQIGIDVSRIFFDIKQGFSNDLKVVVELPEKVYRTLGAKTDTGEITLPVLQADELTIGTDTGDMVLEGFTGKQLSARSDTGTMRLRRVSAETDLGSDTGDLYLDLAALPGDVNLESDTGDIQLTLSQAFPLTADFASDTGRATVTAGSTALDYDLKEKHKLRGKLGGGGPLVKARTDTGDIALNVK
jgi:DUF4097 and DUF4098 domain-containing protein YvlB